MHSHRTWSVLAMAVVCLAGLVMTAEGRAPIVDVESFTAVNELVANCGDFQILLNGSGTTRTTVYFDRDDNPVRLTFQGRASNTLSNSVTGNYLVDAPSVANIFVDLVAQTETNVGAFFTITVPGYGTLLMDTGRIVLDDQGNPTFIAGIHFPPDQQFDILCDALR